MTNSLPVVVNDDVLETSNRLLPRSSQGTTRDRQSYKKKRQGGKKRITVAVEGGTERKGKVELARSPARGNVYDEAEL